MKRKFFSSLLFGALACATLGTVTSCKDYGDDINSLQDQINKAALSSTVESLQTQVQNAATAASEAKTSAATALAAANNAASKELLSQLSDQVSDLTDDVLTNVTDIDDLKEAQKKAEENIETIAATLAAGDEELESALERIGKLESSYVTATALNEKLEALKNEILAASSDAQSIADLKTKVDAYKAAVEALYSAVTSVELVESYSAVNKQGYQLADGNYLVASLLHGTVGENSVFGDNEAYTAAKNPVTYTKGADIKTAATVVIRVNPINADLTKGTTIKLINSKGESIDSIVNVAKVERYNELIVGNADTRAASNNGLWTLSLEAANGVTEKKFKEATQDAEGNFALYAVAVKNTTDDAASDRYVVSSYDLAAEYAKYAPANGFGFTVKDIDIDEIKNRWTGSEIEAEDGTKGDSLEYVWKASSTKVPTPATAAVKTGDAANAEVAANQDARFDAKLLQVAVNETFSLKKFVGADKEKLDHYYVTLDKYNAIESAPSEWNAWSSYQYDGLNTVVPADSTLDITIKSGAAEGDIIGFRVYAVNYDGTLADPDGRAFYVVVGQAADQTLAAGNLYATKKVDAATDTVAFTSKYDLPEWTITNGEDEDVFGANTSSLPKFTAHYLDKDNKEANEASKAAKVYFTVDDISKIIDGATVKLEAKDYKTVQGQQVLATTYKATFTKTMPTVFTGNLTFKPKQETVEGSGDFVIYMTPCVNKSDPWIVENEAAGYGEVYLDNVFQDLSKGVYFFFANTNYDANNKPTLDMKSSGKSNSNTHPSVSQWISVNKDLIDSKTWHDVVAKQRFDGVSYTKKEDGSYKVENYFVASSKKMRAQYACWASANTYAWQKTAAVKDEKGNVTTPASDGIPTLVWTHDGKGTTSTVMPTVDKLVVSNSYDNDKFGGTLYSLLKDKQYLGLSTTKNVTDIKLTYNGQVNPYFTPSYNKTSEGGYYYNISFKQDAQNTNAPTADHVETLELSVVDCYGHTEVIKVPVNVKAPGAKAE